MDTTRPPRNADPDLRTADWRDGGPRSAAAEDRGAPERRTAERPPPGPPGTWDHETESFGAWLCRHRRVRGIELREIAEDSKIGMTYLQAFEDDRFDILPAPVFAKGFLRQYAHYVGLDPEEVVNFYLSAAQQDLDRDEESSEPSGDSRRLGPLKLAGLAIGVVAVLILVWFLTTGRDDAPAEETPLPAEVGGVPASGADAPPSAEADAGGTEAAIEPPAAEPPDTSPLRLTLDFSGECWVEVSVDGERRLAENKIQGESLVLRADRAIDVKIGNVDVVEADLNGHPFRFEDAAGTKVRNQRIDLDTVAALGDAEEKG
jgi:cytoskeletal protein RodZ